MRKAFLSVTVRRVALALVGVVGAVMLSGCPDAARDQPADHSTMLPARDRVSDLPWATPSASENRTGLGPLANDLRIGGWQ